MAVIRFANKINDSVQVGDELFYNTTSGGNPTSLGTITNIGENFVEVNDATGASVGNFFSFKKKDNNVSFSKSGTKGYYASVKMQIPVDSGKTKLFALGSEVSQSSK